MKNMKKYFHLLHFGTLAMALVMLVGSFSLFNPARAENLNTPAPTPDSIVVSAFDRDGQPLDPTNPDDYVNSEFSYDKIHHVELSVRQEYLDLFNNNKEQLIYTIKVARVQSENILDLTTNIASHTFVLDSGRFADLDSSTKLFTFYFDPPEGFIYIPEQKRNNEDETDYTIPNIGWGIYKFIIHVESETQGALEQPDGESKNLFVHPADISAIPPAQVKINMDVTSSMGEMQDAYLFTLDDDIFKYCNQQLIVWYMSGTAIDGTKYALTKTDLENQEFLETSTLKDLKRGMFDTGDAIADLRYGNTFKFDAKTAGTWEVWCTIKGQPVDRSEFKVVTTGRVINSNVLIWVLVGCGVALLGLVVFIIIYTKKREKVW